MFQEILSRNNRLWRVKSMNLPSVLQRFVLLHIKNLFLFRTGFLNAHFLKSCRTFSEYGG